MGSYFSIGLTRGHYNISSSRLPKNDIKILMLGLDSAGNRLISKRGKTTILYKMKSKENVKIIPTEEHNKETVSPTKDITFTIWEVGGHDTTRGLWKHYYPHTKGLFFIVDSNDRERLPEARHELYNILDNEEMKEIPVVVIANKQDLPRALRVSQIAYELDLPTITNRMWRIQGACATSGEGINESMKNMANLVITKQSKDRQFYQS